MTSMINQKINLPSPIPQRPMSASAAVLETRSASPVSILTSEDAARIALPPLLNSRSVSPMSANTCPLHIQQPAAKTPRAASPSWTHAADGHLEDVRPQIERPLSPAPLSAKQLAARDYVLKNLYTVAKKTHTARNAVAYGSRIGAVASFILTVAVHPLGVVGGVIVGLFAPIIGLAVATYLRKSLLHDSHIQNFRAAVADLDDDNLKGLCGEDGEYGSEIKKALEIENFFRANKKELFFELGVMKTFDPVTKLIRKSELGNYLLDSAQTMMLGAATGMSGLKGKIDKKLEAARMQRDGDADEVIELGEARPVTLRPQSADAIKKLDLDTPQSIRAHGPGNIALSDDGVSHQVQQEEDLLDLGC